MTAPKITTKATVSIDYQKHIAHAITSDAKNQAKTGTELALTLPDLMANIASATTVDKFAQLLRLHLVNMIKGEGNRSKDKPFSEKEVVGDFLKELIRMVYSGYASQELALIKAKEASKGTIPSEDVQLISAYIRAIEMSFRRYLKTVYVLIATKAEITSVCKNGLIRGTYHDVKTGVEKEVMRGTMNRILNQLGSTLITPEEVVKVQPFDGKVKDSSMETLCNRLQQMIAGIKFSDITDAKDRDAFEKLFGNMLFMVSNDESAMDSDDVTAFVDSVNAA